MGNGRLFHQRIWYGRCYDEEIGTGWEMVDYLVVKFGDDTCFGAKRFGWDSVNLEFFDRWIGPLPEPPDPPLPVYNMRSPKIVHPPGV